VISGGIDRGRGTERGGEGEACGVSQTQQECPTVLKESERCAGGVGGYFIVLHIFHIPRF